MLPFGSLMQILTMYTIQITQSPQLYIAVVESSSVVEMNSTTHSRLYTVCTIALETKKSLNVIAVEILRSYSRPTSVRFRA